MTRRGVGLACVAMLAAIAVVPAAHAQTSAPVQFERGSFGATINGTIIGDEYIDYTLGAKAGQEMTVAMSAGASNGTGAVYYNILPPGSTGEAIYNSSVEGDRTTVRLPEDGTYAIRVYLMGDDADSGKTSSYSIEVSIR